MAAVTDLRPINGEYETLYRVNQELKGEKQAYKRLSKEHLWTIFKMAIGALMIAAGVALFVALFKIACNDVGIRIITVCATSFVVSFGSGLLAESSCIHKHQVNEKQSRKETIQRLKAESEAIAINIKVSA